MTEVGSREDYSIEWCAGTDCSESCYCAFEKEYNYSFDGICLEDLNEQNNENAMSTRDEASSTESQVARIDGESALLCYNLHSLGI